MDQKIQAAAYYDRSTSFRQLFFQEYLVKRVIRLETAFVQC
jgi:hypothetical protein